MRLLSLALLCAVGCYDDAIRTNPYDQTPPPERVVPNPGQNPDAPWCGNGTVDPGEACDDGNTRDDDGCTNACRTPEDPGQLVAVPVVDAVAGSRRFERNESGAAIVAPFQPIRLSGRLSQSREGAIIAYEWSVNPEHGALRPDGSQIRLDDPSKDRPRLMYSVRGDERPGVDLNGEYQVALRVQDESELWSDWALVRVEAKPNRALWVELSWDVNAHDIDLHLIRGDDPTGLFSTENDCYFANCVPDRIGTPVLDWGGASQGDDPFLDVDDIDGRGPEVISILAPEDQMVYHVGLHNYRLDFAESPTATLKIFIDGEVVEEASRAMPSHNDWWHAFRIEWGDEVEVIFVDDYTDDAPRPAIP